MAQQHIDDSSKPLSGVEEDNDTSTTSTSFVYPTYNNSKPNSRLAKYNINNTAATANNNNSNNNEEQASSSDSCQTSQEKSDSSATADENGEQQQQQPPPKPTPTQAKEGPFVATKTFPQYLCKDEEGLTPYYDPKHEDFKALTDYMESQVPVILDELQKLTMVRSHCYSAF